MKAVAARGRFTHPSDFQIAPGPACTPLESRQHLSATARQPRQLSQAVDRVVENFLSLFLSAEWAYDLCTSSIDMLTSSLIFVCHLLDL